MSTYNKFELLNDFDEESELSLQNTEVKEHTSVKPKGPKQEKSVNDLDLYLCSKQQIKINYTVSKKEKNETHERVFNVVSKYTYENFKKLILRYKSHKNDKLNWEEQKNKIKMANNLMSLCYKDPSQKCTFIYPVVIITLRNGKTLTKNYIREDSGLQFTINDIVYNMGKQPEETKEETL